MSRPIHGDDVYRALAHPARRKMLELFTKDGPQTPADLMNAFSLSRTSISQHLRALRDARLVVQRRRGRARVYDVRTAPVKSVVVWLNAIAAE